MDWVSSSSLLRIVYIWRMTDRPQESSACMLSEANPKNNTPQIRVCPKETLEWHASFCFCMRAYRQVDCHAWNHSTSVSTMPKWTKAAEESWPSYEISFVPFGEFILRWLEWIVPVDRRKNACSWYLYQPHLKIMGSFIHQSVFLFVHSCTSLIRRPTFEAWQLLYAPPPKPCPASLGL